MELPPPPARRRRAGERLAGGAVDFSVASALDLAVLPPSLGDYCLSLLRALTFLLIPALFALDGLFDFALFHVGSNRTPRGQRDVPGGDVVALLFSEAKMASLVRLGSTGRVEWGPTNYDSHGEATDVVVEPAAAAAAETAAATMTTARLTSR